MPSIPTPLSKEDADPSLFEASPDLLSGDFDILTIDHRAAFNIGDTPTLFLPVRLETRYFGSELRVRIYPDQIHLDGHEPALSETEIKLGQAYWRTRHGGDPDLALETLTQKIQPRRAVWVAGQIRPTGRDGDGPAFPKIEPRAGTSPARTRLLPERIAVVGFVDNERRFVAFGQTVDKGLPFSPDLTEAASTLDDDPMAWMIDYEKALSAGMAVSISLPGFDYGSSGLTLLVLGIGDASQSVDALSDQLTAHHYTHGLEITPQGTPTNNTDEAIAGWTRGVDDVAVLFARELDGDGIADDEASAAGHLINAFGLGRDSVLRRAEHAGLDEDSAMAAMNAALWPVTWGRYLDDMLAPEDGPSIVPQSVQRALRAFFVDFVRGGAALPGIAIGDQPYGVLPVMRRDGGDLQSSDSLIALEAILLDLRARWRDSLPAVPRLDPIEGGSSDQAVAEILGSLPHPMQFVVRRLTWQWSLRTALWKGLWDSVSAVGSPFAGLGFVKSRTFQTVTSIEDEIAWLEDLRADPSLAGIADEDIESAKVILDSFIFQCESHLARQEPLNDWYADAFSGVLDEDVTTDPKIIFSDYGTAHEDEIFNHPLVRSDHAAAAHYLNELAGKVPGTSSGGGFDRPIDLEPFTPGQLGRRQSVRSLSRARQQVDLDVPDITIPLPDAFFSSKPLLYQLIDSIIADIDPAHGDGYRDTLAVLAGRSEAELELRLQETLGLAGYRLDAWLTAFAKQALDQHRKTEKEKDTSLRIGGYGWVEGLRPDADGTHESQGFIHAPTLAHATTAAVLRAGFHAHGADDPEGLYATDLRSDRVRTAAWLFDGVRQGQALGDLLGCRFERQLHDAGADQFIDDCRRRVLEAEGTTRQPRGPVDGLKLAARYQADGIRIDLPDGGSFIVRPDDRQSEPDRRRLQNALSDILQSMDAISDASIADSVHHLLQGNSSRATAMLDAIATGAASPPELRGLDNTYGGTSLSHRALLLFDGEDDGTGAGWALSPRARLEPALAGFAAAALGNPATILCVVKADAMEEGERVSLLDLAKDQAFSALDAVVEPLSTWQARAQAFMLSSGVLGETKTAAEVDPTPDLDEGEISFQDAAMLAKALAQLLAGKQAMRAADLAMPGEHVEPSEDLSQAEDRLEAFRKSLLSARDALRPLLPLPGKEGERPVGTADLTLLRAALMDLAAHGVGTPPTIGFDEADRDALYGLAWIALDRANARLDAHAALDVDASLEKRLDALHGKSIPLLPPFVANPDQQAVLSRSSALLPEGTAPATAWLHGMARVRPDLRHLDEVMTLGDLLHDSTLFRPSVSQLPWVEGDPWLAIGAPSDRKRQHLALFMLDQGGGAALVSGKMASGLVIDSWSELIPGEDSVTGVAVNYDAPTSRPPQALLLALPPDGRAWSFDHMVDTLLETLEAAKLRMVDIDNLLAYGHQAPAIFPPSNIASGVQETDDG